MSFCRPSDRLELGRLFHTRKHMSRKPPSVYRSHTSLPLFWSAARTRCVSLPVVIDGPQSRLCSDLSNLTC
jgi:hypothetical protein